MEISNAFKQLVRKTKQKGEEKHKSWNDYHEISVISQDKNLVEVLDQEIRIVIKFFLIKVRI